VARSVVAGEAGLGWIFHPLSHKHHERLWDPSAFTDYIFPASTVLRAFHQAVAESSEFSAMYEITTLSPASARASILAAVNAVPAGTNQNLNRAKAAIYLVASSSQYQIEY